MLPELQETILLMMVKLGPNKTVNHIQQAVSLEKGVKEQSFGSMFTSLDRLESKKFVEWTIGEPINQKGGRAPRHYTITTEGRRVLATSIDEKAKKYSEINTKGIWAALT